MLRRYIGLPGRFITVWKNQTGHTHIHAYTPNYCNPVAHVRRGLIIKDIEYDACKALHMSIAVYLTTLTISIPAMCTPSGKTPCHCRVPYISTPKCFTLTASPNSNVTGSGLAFLLSSFCFNSSSVIPAVMQFQFV